MAARTNSRSDFAIDMRNGRSALDLRVGSKVYPQRVESGICGDPSARTTDPAVPIACSLDGGQMTDRAAEWQAALANVVARKQIAGGVRLVLAANTALDEVARLAVAEQECCRFLSFAITVDDRGIGLEVRAPGDALPIVESLFGARA